MWYCSLVAKVVTQPSDGLWGVAEKEEGLVQQVGPLQTRVLRQIVLEAGVWVVYWTECLIGR